MLDKANVRWGRTQSCGCLNSEITKKRNHRHGYAKRNKPTPEYRTWLSVKARCYYKNSRTYARYGGAGIRMCSRWRHSFDMFLADMGPRPSSKHSIDRINHKGHYEPSNCRWATWQQQAENRSVTHWIEFRGQTMTVHGWARVLGIKRSTLDQRLNAYGWSVERALTTPVRQPHD